MTLYAPLLKILALAVTGIGHYYATTPPRPAPEPDEKAAAAAAEDGAARWFERAIPWIRGWTATLVGVWIVCEIVLTALLIFPSTSIPSSRVYHVLCPHPSSSSASHHQSISVLFALGAGLAVLGAALRVWCYAVLGHRFTYEVALRREHTLVCSAPYNWVRHPSYTGFFMHLAGIALVLYAPGGWNAECGQIGARAAARFWMTTTAYTSWSVWRRGEAEDALLRARFGEAWEAYRRDVPWRFFPGLV
ncbi:hypothetical protein BDW22DRAFT_1485540 [Trametopsis cervina]|nr:hypothetical protein BDW22DRAFT_1485540 [Trametopsis cervina]